MKTMFLSNRKIGKSHFKTLHDNKNIFYQVLYMLVHRIIGGRSLSNGFSNPVMIWSLPATIIPVNVRSIWVLLYFRFSCIGSYVLSLNKNSGEVASPNNTYQLVRIPSFPLFNLQFPFRYFWIFFWFLKLHQILSCHRSHTSNIRCTPSRR